MSVPNEHFTTLQGAYDVDLMEVTLQVRRYAGDGARAETESYTVEVPDEATLLDVLDAVKDTRDGTLAYRKCCRMAVCGSCGMRMDGGAVLACKTPMKPLVDAGPRTGHVSPMGNLPVIKDLVVDMAPFWHKVRAIKPWLDEHRRATPPASASGASAGGARPDHQGVAVHHVRLLRLRVQLDGGRPGLPRARRRWPRRLPLRRRRARPAARKRAPRDLSTARTASGTAPAATSATSAAPRASTRATRSPSWAPRCSSEGMHGDGGAKHAKVFVSSTYKARLPARDGAGAGDGRRRWRDQGDPVRAEAGARRQGAEPAEAAQGEGATTRCKRLWTSCSRSRSKHELEARATRGPARSDSKDGREEAATPTTPAASPACRRRSSTPRRRAIARAARRRAGRHAPAHVLRRRRHPRGEARLLPAPERAHPRPGRAARAATRC